MEKTIGIVLSILGGLGCLIFGMRAVQNSESFSILGLDIAISSANWTPVIISGVILLVGIILLLRK